MTLARSLIIILSFYFFAVVQNSFLPYFNLIGVIPNFIFILFFILIFFKNKNEYAEGFFIAILAGFFLDILSPFYLPAGRQVFGVSIIFMLIVYFLEKFTVHFLKEGMDKYPIFYFIPLFLICFLFFNIFSYLFLILLNFGFSIKWDIIFVSLYNLIFALPSFYFYKKFINKNNQDNQLKLL